MDLASVVAALASVGARVSGSTPNSSVRVDSSRACPPGLAGPEPSGTIHDLGHHFQVPVCYSPPLLAGFRCRWWWAVPATPGWGLPAAVVCGV